MAEAELGIWNIPDPSKGQDIATSYPANTLRKSNVILGLHFGNLPKLLSVDVMVRNLIEIPTLKLLFRKQT